MDDHESDSELLRYFNKTIRMLARKSYTSLDVAHLRNQVS